MDNRLKLAGAAGLGIVATLAAGGIALAAIGPGAGRFGAVDGNGDGRITRAEWVAAANARFVKLDANRDGALVASEMPRRHGRGHGRHGGHHGREAQPPAPAAPVPPAPAR